MIVLTGAALSDRIHQIMKEQVVDCAVAFWGSGADQKWGKLRGQRVRIICNLSMGGSNPSVIEKLMKRYSVKQHDRLHAKVYIGKTEAVITSANASTNGLGLEGGVALSGWIECGAVVPSMTIRPWFENLWADKSSRKIESHDLAAARQAFRSRKDSRTISFSLFDPLKDELPLVCWVNYGRVRIDKYSVIRQHGLFNPTVEKRIRNGIDLEGNFERKLREGTWLLYWDMKNGKLAPSARPFDWTQAGGPECIVEEAFSYDDDDQKIGVMLQAEKLGKPPFTDANTPRFRKAFSDILSRPKYKLLREEEYDGSFLEPRQHLMRPFWRDVKKRYTDIDKDKTG